MSNPVVTVVNSSSRIVFVDNDPNWDDQQLLINGQPFTQIYTLSPGGSVTVGVDWEGAGDAGMMGVIFAEEADYDYGKKSDFYQQSLGQDSASGFMAVTDSFTVGAPAFRYELGNQQPWSMTMDFKDAS